MNEQLVMLADPLPPERLEMLRRLFFGEPGFYTGVGSREVPRPVGAVMRELGDWLARRGWTLRSGAATGSDTDFEEGVPDIYPVELYLPWPGFGLDPEKGHVPVMRVQRVRKVRASAAAYELASIHHPAWMTLSDSDKALHARNGHEVLGPELLTPSKFVACWTPDGADGVRRKVGGRTGGTGQAIRVAAATSIPVFNLWDPALRAEVERIIGYARGPMS